VQLAVFAIDIDRVYVARDGAGEPWRFGWEVMLTEAQRGLGVEPCDAMQQLRLLEDTCMSVLEQPPDAQALGSQLVFAAYSALERGKLPAPLRAVFASWRRPPRQLLTALSELWVSADVLLPELATACLAEPLRPPLAEPTRAALARLAG
jgi:hypothetical protein